MSDEMNRLDEIAARRESPGNRELIDGGCEGAGEYGGCHDASVLIEAMDADLAVLLAAVREVQTVHARYFNTDVPPDHEDAGCEPEDVWRFDRDFRAALSALTETEETNR